MILGFDEDTYELTDLEEKMIPLFVRGFSSKLGKINSITNREIVAKMKKYHPFLTEARVRKIINYIRKKNLVPGLIASSSGYYVTRDPREIERYIVSLSGRIKEIERIRESFYEFLEKVQSKPVSSQFK